MLYQDSIPPVDNFLNYHYLSAWQCIKIVRRIYKLITPGSQRVNSVIWCVRVSSRTGILVDLEPLDLDPTPLPRPNPMAEMVPWRSVFASGNSLRRSIFASGFGPTSLIWNPLYNSSVEYNGLFAGDDHMVQNPPYWNANCALGHPKQSDLNHSSLNLLCFECPSAQFAFHYGGFCTMWSYPAKGLLIDHTSRVLDMQNILE